MIEIKKLAIIAVGRLAKHFQYYEQTILTIRINSCNSCIKICQPIELNLCYKDEQLLYAEIADLLGQQCYNSL